MEQSSFFESDPKRAAIVRVQRVLTSYRTWYSKDKTLATERSLKDYGCGIIQFLFPNQRVHLISG